MRVRRPKTEADREYSRQYYAQLVSAGLCVRCKGAADAGVYCACCVEHNRLRKLAKIDQIRAADRRRFKRNYAERVENGMCVNCGARPRGRTVRCVVCQGYITRHSKARYSGPGRKCSVCGILGHNRLSCEATKEPVVGVDEMATRGLGGWVN